jgi:transposase
MEQRMNSTHLFKLALGIQSPWEVMNIQMEDTESGKELHIYIDFKPGSKFVDASGALCEVYDTKQKTWRHLNFFQHPCYLHCRVPRIKTKEGKVQLVEVPWSRSGIGMDETSQRKGHDYVTLAVDFGESRVLHVTEGKDKEAVKAVKDYLESKGIDIKKVKHASMDMSPSYISGVHEYFPKAEIHFDRFHMVKLLNEAMDKVRQLERKEHDELKGHKYTFLKNRNKLSDQKKQELSEFITLFPTLGKAYRLKELFNDLWETEEEAVGFLVDWSSK